MKYSKIKIRDNAVLTAYIHEQTSKLPHTSSLPAVLILPGGGYEHCSPREGEPVALAFLSHGCNAFVLDYSTGENAVGRAPLLDVAAAYEHIAVNHSDYLIDPKRLMTVGFSAGAHLTGWFNGSNSDPDIAAICAAAPRSAAQALCYPVVSAGEYAHEGSFTALFGDDRRAWATASVERLVSRNTPPTFIFHCSGDKTVSPMNSLLLAQALDAQHVPYELHIYGGGEHAVALANEFTGRPFKPAVSWIKDFLDFAVRING